MRFVELTNVMILTAPEEEDDSNEEDLIVQEESDADTEETQSAPEDESTSTQIPNITTSSPSTPTSRTKSHGAAVAATRGLQIRTDRQRHTMSQPPNGPGLPTSPRPMQKFSTATLAFPANPTAPPSSSS
jgi:FtsZ-interacting cell division protein YlmF